MNTKNFKIHIFCKAEKQLMFSKIFFLPRKCGKKFCDFFFANAPFCVMKPSRTAGNVVYFFIYFFAKIKFCVKFFFCDAFILMLPIWKLGIVGEQ